MTIITIPPEIEGRLADEARRRGTTPELVALDGLRQLFATPATDNGAALQGSLFDFLDGYIGTIAGSTERYSEDCGRRFADGAAVEVIR